MGKPKIRFKGYEDDWEQRKVTDLGEIYIGLVTTMTEHYTDKGCLLIRNSDIKDGYFEFGENPIYLDGEFSEQNKSRMHQLGDVITVHTGDIGTSAVIGENEVNSIGFATIVTRPNQEILDSNYFATYLNTDTHKQWAISMATGDGRSNYNLKDYMKLVVPIPQIEEQKKIATCIGNLNKLITLHQRKCEETKSLKKYMLQKMFPENGKCVPKIRFSGFSDDWEQRKLSELVIIERGGSPRPIDKFITNDENGLNWVKIGDAPEQGNYITKTAEKIKPEGLSKTRKVHPGDLILSNSMSFGRPYIMAINGCIHDGWLAIRDTQKRFDLKFLCTLLGSDSMLNQYKAMAAGSTVNNLNKELVGSTTVSFPKMEEQVKIGEYFDNLDHLITLHQHKCDELQKLKKFMLQNMFV